MNKRLEILSIKSNSIVFGLLLLFVVACTNKNAFEIKGKFSNTNGQLLYFSKMTTQGNIPIDSTVVDETGNFLFREEVNFTDFFVIHTTNNNAINLLIGPGDNIYLEGDIKNLYSSYSVQGSEDCKLVRELTAYLDSNINRIGVLNKIYQDSIRSPNIREIKSDLDRQFFEIVENQRKFSISFIERNYSSLSSLMALYQQLYRGGSVFNSIDDIQYFKLVDSALFVLYPESEAVKVLHAEVKEMNRQIKEMEKNELITGIGVVPPDIALPTPDNDTILLSSLKGKYVLLDFWASWCTPCRVENPNLVANYNKYHSKGFEIFQVSLDKSREAWVNAIENDGLQWIHVSDLKFWDSQAARLYNITAIPASFLLDKNGRIIAKNLRGEQLGQKLGEIFK